MNLLTYVTQILAVWKRVFTKPKYLLIGILAGFLFYLINGLIVARPNFQQFFNAFGIIAIWKILQLSLNFSYMILPFTFVGIVLLSILIGVLISLLFYRFDNFASVKGGSTLAAIGIFLGMAAPGCAACGVGLISLIGLGSAIAVLPFQGKEILIFSILITLFSLSVISKKLYNPVCNIPMKGGKNERYDKNQEK